MNANKKKISFSREIGTVLALVFMIVVFSIINPIYLNPANLVDIVSQSTINGLLAIGITFVIITSGIDLSVGSIMAVVIVGVGKFLVAGISPIFAIIIGLFLGFLLGSINGLIITKLKLQPFIATLGTMSIYRGIAYIITKGWPVLDIPNNFRNIIDGRLFSNFPSSIIILIIFAIIGHILSKYKKLGIYIYAIGGNEEATRLSGIDVDYNKIMAYGISGIGAALAGLVMLGRLGTGEPTAGIGYELNAIAAAAIGGTSLAGGKGSIIGTLLGAILLSSLKVGLVVIGVDTFYQYIATGLIIILAAFVEIIQEKFKKSGK